MARTHAGATARNFRTGFTLVELLVVIAIIGVLAGLLLPAIGMAREAARRAACINNMGQIAKAVINYEGNKQHYPPSCALQPNTPPNAPVNVCWVPPLLGQLGRNDLFSQYEQGTLYGNTASGIQEAVLQCPNDTDPVSNRLYPLSFAMNGGIHDVTLKSTNAPWDVKENGLFFNRNNAQVPRTSQVAQDSAYLARYDGASNTILASEKYGDSYPNGWGPIAQGYDWQQLILWTGNTQELTDWTGSTMPDLTASKDLPTLMTLKNGNITVNSLPSNAVPYGAHPSVVVVAFADGGVRAVGTEMSYRVYANLMSPFGDNAKYSKAGNPQVAMPYPPVWMTGTRLTPLNSSESQ